MIIRSDALLTALSEKAQSYAQDRSRHVLCPACRTRTRLYTLGDGRRKCGRCGMKFTARRKSDTMKLRQYADIVLCFCMSLPVAQAARITGYRYRLVSAVYRDLRLLLARQNLSSDRLELLTRTEQRDFGVHDSAFCHRCRNRLQCRGRKKGDSMVFGVKVLAGSMFIEPLEDNGTDIQLRLNPAAAAIGHIPYAGFICAGSFHRFADSRQQDDGAERLWAWMNDHLKRHHGIHRRTAGLYLKELEWKYNNRQLTPEEQGMQLARLMPDDFLTAGKPD